MVQSLSLLLPPAPVEEEEAEAVLKLDLWIEAMSSGVALSISWVALLVLGLALVALKMALIIEGFVLDI